MDDCAGRSSGMDGQGLTVGFDRIKGKILFGAGVDRKGALDRRFAGCGIDRLAVGKGDALADMEYSCVVVCLLPAFGDRGFRFGILIQTDKRFASADTGEHPAVIAVRRVKAGTDPEHRDV